MPAAASAMDCRPAAHCLQGAGGWEMETHCDGRVEEGSSR